MKRIPSYPNRIIPRQYYKNIHVDKSLYDHFLIRYDIRQQPIPDFETFEKIRKENFSTKAFKNGWSTTLVGVFSNNDARFVIKKESNERLSKIWNRGSKPLKVRNKDYVYIVNRGYFGLLIRDVLNCTFDMDVIIDNRIARIDEVRYEIVHEPTHCNYWHFAIYAYAIHGTTKEKYYLRNDLPSKNAASNATRNIAEVLKKYVVLQNNVERVVVPRGIYAGRDKKTRFYKAKRCKK